MSHRTMQALSHEEQPPLHRSYEKSSSSGGSSPSRGSLDDDDNNNNDNNDTSNDSSSSTASRRRLTPTRDEGANSKRWGLPSPPPPPPPLPLHSPSSARAAARDSATKRRMRGIETSSAEAASSSSPSSPSHPACSSPGGAKSSRRRPRARLFYWSLALATTAVLSFLQRELSGTMEGGAGLGEEGTAAAGHGGRRVPVATEWEVRGDLPVCSEVAGHS
jgi:hypothetical protein